MFKRNFTGCLVILLSGAMVLPAVTVRAADLEDSSLSESGAFSETPPETSGTGSEPYTEEPVTTEEPVETEAPAETEFFTETDLPGESETEYETEYDTEVPSETEYETVDLSETETEPVTESEEVTEGQTASETETESETRKETELQKETEKKPDFEGTDFVSEDEKKKEDTVIEQGTIDYVRSTTIVPVEGLPGAITQEMVSAVLYCQDRTGFPASAALAQLIAESVQGDNTDYMTDKAYRTHNLFGMRSDGALKSYHTDSESVFDFYDLLESEYTDIVKNASDLDLYTEQFARRWSGRDGYGEMLIRIIDEYQLYRLDKVTLEEFESLLPTYVNPCPGTVISSTFGYRELFHSMHQGIDLATGGRNIATYAARGGEVIFAGESGLAGNMICILHDDGVVTNYMHHCEMYVEAGDHVFKGQQIGLAGSTGRSTGIHLHFEIEIGGTPVNPAPYLKDDSSGIVIAMDGGRKQSYKLSKAVLGQILSGAPPKHEVSVPKVKNSELPGELRVDIIGSHN